MLCRPTDADLSFEIDEPLDGGLSFEQFDQPTALYLSRRVICPTQSFLIETKNAKSEKVLINVLTHDSIPFRKWFIPLRPEHPDDQSNSSLGTLMSQTIFPCILCNRRQTLDNQRNKLDVIDVVVSSVIDEKVKSKHANIV